ncbi:MAG TPA: HAMP domain-containing sensor histidine kinase [bacterium]|nr:HAMP domain-containing sensor histidine kinase [bacterium]
MRSLGTRLSVAVIAVAVLTTVLSATFSSYTARQTFRQYVERREAPAPVPGGSVSPGPGERPANVASQPERRRPPLGAREILFESRFRNAIWGGTGIAVLLGLLLTLWLTHRLVRPITDLTSAARVIARGGTPPPVPVRGQDEVAELARAFNKMTERLAADEEQRRRLFAGVAHELRTPLSVIQGTLEGMLDHVLEATPERITTLHSQSLLLARLITDLRDLSLAQAGQLQLNVQPIDAGPVVRETLEALAPLADERSVVLQADILKGLPRIDADPDRLRQIVQNLVENAVRYTPAGGEIHVSMQADEADVRLAVSDTGIGVAAADLPYIFRHFYRADQSRARSSGGTGLGLAIVKSLVEAHGGRVAVESAVGRGSTFTVTFPRRQEAAKAQEAMV